MYRILSLLLLVLATACNNGAEPATTSSSDSTKSSSYTWSAEDEKEFLAGCVDEAKVKMEEKAAFANCKCVLEQLRKTYPTMDSAADALADTALAARFAAVCK